ncbi:MAG TPA: spermidine/putrescine ABC transporter substrate-binding protein [Gammaproteobacteria bacterium]|nr:spermidine/putrescine ABC transporter substrate-binding protein [Gammaproteobacteria bacterium]
MLRLICFYAIVLFSLAVTDRLFADVPNVVNVYTFGEEIPGYVIAQFERETGIRVNYSSYETNEIMYSKLRATTRPEYDVVEPSSYYVDRMRHQNMLEKLDKTRLSGYKNLDPFFLDLRYDPHSDFSIPFVWGITGIFTNRNYFSAGNIVHWSDLFNKKYFNQLMILDDPREAFSMALLMLGYSINDTNPAHIKEAYQKLRTLMPNIRLFNTDAVASILIDEDAAIGIAWNGDLARARTENTKLNFVYPTEGFEIWVDNFVILKNAPHRANAYKFLDFLMRPDIAKKVSLAISYSTANLAAKNLLPPDIKNDAVLYPSPEVLSHGQFEVDIGDTTYALLEKYWEQLKMEG